MNKVKVIITVILTVLMEWLGILAVPVFLLVGCNIMDYITGLVASKYRMEKVNSYKSIGGIFKKVCMWLLVLVGAWMDVLINYAFECANIELSLPFIVATVVAVWLIASEMISILENMIDIGVSMPPFLLPLVKYIRNQMEDKAALRQTKIDLPENGDISEEEKENE